MAANLLTELLPPNSEYMFPIWVVLCLVPAYWYGQRLGMVSYDFWEVLETVGIVLAAVVMVKLWSVIRPLWALALATLICLLFLLRHRLLRSGRSGRR